MIGKALLKLRPGIEWNINGEEYEDIQWFGPPGSMPTKDEVLKEIERLRVEHTQTEYRRLREKEYPPVTDYLDAVVKGDQDQIDRYIAACLAVKAKYPKPTD